MDGEVKAKHSLAGILLNVIDELEMDGEEVSGASIKAKLEKRVSIYTTKDNSEVA